MSKPSKKSNPINTSLSCPKSTSTSKNSTHPSQKITCSTSPGSPLLDSKTLQKQDSSKSLKSQKSKTSKSSSVNCCSVTQQQEQQEQYNNHWIDSLSQHEIENLKEVNDLYVCTSAKLNQNVNTCFEQLAEMVFLHKKLEYAKKYKGEKRRRKKEARLRRLTCGLWKGSQEYR